MHVRTLYAAVSDETPSADANDGATRERHNAKATQTLWAERPLHVHGGRLTAVRLTGEQLHVGFVPASTRSLLAMGSTRIDRVRTRGPDVGPFDPIPALATSTSAPQLLDVLRQAIQEAPFVSSSRGGLLALSRPWLHGFSRRGSRYLGQKTFTQGRARFGNFGSTT